VSAWLWLGCAVLLLPPVRASGPAAPAERSPLSRRALQLTGAVCAAAVVLIGVGGTSGVLAAGPAAVGAWVAAARLYQRPSRAQPDPALPLALDLIAAAVRAGQPVSAALLLAAPVADERCGAALVRVARLLALGADPAEAWASLAQDPLLRDLARAARRSATSGIRLAAAFEQTAVDLRAARRATAQARASRAGAFATVPLGLCFLPAFVCLAIVPVVVGIAGTALGSAQ
jgi:Flp pilus assembly protein TadB